VRVTVIQGTFSFVSLVVIVVVVASTSIYLYLSIISPAFVISVTSMHLSVSNTQADMKALDIAKARGFSEIVALLQYNEV
jgi:hypothetical protein